jgi:hypothetical protein
MPVEIMRLENGEGVLLKAYDPLSGKDKIKVNEDLLQSANNLANLRYMVVDEACAGFQLSTTEARIVAAQDMQIAKLTPRGLVVAVISPSDVDFGMARMWRVFSHETGWEIGVFRSWEDAADWLTSRIGVKSYSSLVAKLHASRCSASASVLKARLSAG